MSKQLVVIADSDALIAQAKPDDVHHKVAVEISNKLIASGAQVIYPVTTVAETTAYVQRVLNSVASAYQIALSMTDPAVQVAEVNQQILSSALTYFGPKASKKHTLFECIVAAVAKEYRADAIFSFDKFYRTCGFKLASELL